MLAKKELPGIRVNRTKQSSTRASWLVEAYFRPHSLLEVDIENLFRSARTTVASPIVTLCYDLALLALKWRKAELSEQPN